MYRAEESKERCHQAVCTGGPEFFFFPRAPVGVGGGAEGDEHIAQPAGEAESP